MYHFSNVSQQYQCQRDDDRVILRTQIDKIIGPSVDDRKFVTLKSAEFHKDTPSDGNWSIQVPLKESNPAMP